MRPLHVVNVSGGKDSTACYLLALERGRPFRAVMADTGHESPVTIEYAAALGPRTGGPPVELVRADFAADMARKRRYIAEAWPAEGVPPERVTRALELVQPTGNPFLDLCILKGRFPSSQRRFCTEWLKERPVAEQIVEPALERGRVVQWLGVRRDESERRARAPLFQRVRRDDKPHDVLFYRPLIHWTAADVFAAHRRHGLEPNPLYKQGMGRVGCWPCILAQKAELAEIARRDPQAFARLAEWEALVAACSKRGLSTFFAADKTPEGAAAAERWKRRGRPADQHAYPGALEVARWARTSRGGRQFTLLELLEDDDGLSCSSQYGLCE